MTEKQIIATTTLSWLVLIAGKTAFAWTLPKVLPVSNHPAGLSSSTMVCRLCRLGPYK
jgi:hypothetical protein